MYYVSNFDVLRILICVAVVAFSLTQAKAEKPNVLFIAIDDLRPELGCYGSPIVKTPIMDGLASQGLLFNRAYCQQAICRPSRASLMTGTRPETTGLFHNYVSLRELQPDVVTLPQHFIANSSLTLRVGIAIIGLGTRNNHDTLAMATETKKKRDKGVQNVGAKKATDFAFKSKLTGPIAELSFLRKSVLFAEVSMISYMSIEECNIAAGKLGFTNGKFFDTDGAQAYWFHNEWDGVVVCRGTEPHEWEDIKADANALTAVAETVGKVHRGFKNEVDRIWPHIEEALDGNKKPLWFCGHSLGGAMANICANRCSLSYIESDPAGLFTYGSPRIGCKRYVSHVEIQHNRWVNNNDVVCRVPPVFMGYRHNGTERYIDRHGKLKDLKGWKRVSDRVQGLLKGLMRFRIDYLSDHSALDYIDNVFDIARAEEAADGNKS